MVKQTSALRARRLADPRQLTVEQAAEAIGIYPSYYLQIETGSRRPGMATALRIAEFFEITVDEVISAAVRVDESSTPTKADIATPQS